MNENMKKRLIESAAIIAGLVVLFVVIDLIMNGAAENAVEIDGEIHSLTAVSLDIAPMTDNGLERIADLRRLERLTITPYKAKLRLAVDNDPNIEDKRKMYDEIERSYGSCTDIPDISFLKGLDKLEYLDISYCAVDDISVLSGLESLQEVDISYTDVADISPLLSLPELTTVNISGLELSDDSIKGFTDKGFSVMTDDVSKMLKK